MTNWAEVTGGGGSPVIKKELGERTHGGIRLSRYFNAALEYNYLWRHFLPNNINKLFISSG